jgi:hypothetical protein
MTLNPAALIECESVLDPILEQLTSVLDEHSAHFAGPVAAALERLRSTAADTSVTISAAILEILGPIPPQRRWALVARGRLGHGDRGPCGREDGDDEPVNFDHEQRFERIVAEYLERPAGDYAELLHRGYVTSPPGVDAEQWRAEIRAQARKDEIRVTTIRDGDRAIAARKRVLSAEQESEELRYELERDELLRSLKHAAEELGHEIRVWVRNDRESITSCARCGARIYVRIERPPVTDGEAISEPCAAA